MSKQEELINALAEKYPVKHKPTCYLNQNWDEAIQALMDTPEAYRGEDWYIAVSEITDKRSNCSCGAKDEFISDLRTLLSQLVPGEEENFPLAFIDWLGENFLWDKYMRYYVPRDTDMENAKYLKTVKEAYYYWMSLTD